jgi:hypothetical protein
MILPEPCIFTFRFSSFLGSFVVFSLKLGTFMCFFFGLCDSQSSGMKTWEKTGFGHCSDAEPCVFTITLISMFPKPCVFSVGFHEYGLAAVQWIAAPAADFSRKACKNWGSGNMRKKKHVKT